MRSRVVPRAFYRRDSRVVAPELLNKVLVAGGCSGRIVEVEAYPADDPACHAYRGETARNRVMFGPPGHLYVYFTYGMHWCVNAVCGERGEGTAILIRALDPLDGLEAMRSRRPRARRDRDLCNGPAKLAQALALDAAADGADLTVRTGQVHVVDDGTPPPPVPGVSERIGLSVGTRSPWRWFVTDDPNVSRRRGHDVSPSARP